MKIRALRMCGKSPTSFIKMAMGQDTESTHKINSVLVPNNEPKEENVRKTILFTIA